MGGTKYDLKNVLTEEQVHRVVTQCVGEDQWSLVGADVRPACEGLSGFVGEHIKATLTVRAREANTTIHLFIKRIPHNNQPKADFIAKHNFYEREMVLFLLIDEMSRESDANPYCPRALLCTKELLVLPDLSVLGYRPRHHQLAFDLAHARVALAAVARFHAAFANHHTAAPHHALRRHRDALAETIFQPESLWLHAAAKLATDFLDTFSSKYTRQIPDFERILIAKFKEACDTLKEYERTVNVVLHKDLWANNIMFRYENDEPVNAILIDYQCARYGPPSFDVMNLLYLTTSRDFRVEHEKELLDFYYRTFCDSLDDATKGRMADLLYDRKDFLERCEGSRMMMLCLAIGIFPFILMEPVTAARTFDEPGTFLSFLEGDRAAPVLRHARASRVYRERTLEVAEEFVERFFPQQLVAAGSTSAARKASS